MMKGARSLTHAAIDQ